MATDAMTSVENSTSGIIATAKANIQKTDRQHQYSNHDKQAQVDDLRSA